MSSSSICEPLLPGDAAVVGADELFAGQLVEALGEALGEAAAVREDDRAAVLPDQLEDRRVDRGPDARPRLGVRRRAAGLLVERQDLAGRGHVLDRDDDLELERLASAGIDDRHVAAGPDAAEEAGDRLERALGRAQADPLGWTPLVAAVASPFVTRWSRRSSVRARWAPRFEPAIAWTSSTITCSTPLRTSRAWLVSIR